MRRSPVPEFVQAALDLVGGRVQLVAGVGQLTQPPVLLLVLLGLGDHPLDLGLVQVGALADGDPLLGTGVLVAGGDVQDPVRVDVEGDLDLRLAAGGGPDVLQPEPAQHPVVGGAFPLALQDHHIDRGLVVLGGAEGLGAAGGDRGVALDDLGHDAAEGLDAQRQRGDVEQDDVLDLALEHGGLDGLDHRVVGHHGLLTLRCGRPAHHRFRDHCPSAKSQVSQAPIAHPNTTPHAFLHQVTGRRSEPPELGSVEFPRKT